MGARTLVTKPFEERGIKAQLAGGRVYLEVAEPSSYGNRLDKLRCYGTGSYGFGGIEAVLL